jgi:hypothetical protein
MRTFSEKKQTNNKLAAIREKKRIACCLSSGAIKKQQIEGLCGCGEQFHSLWLEVIVFKLGCASQVH